jgi:hypothetical protein
MSAELEIEFIRSQRLDEKHVVIEDCTLVPLDQVLQAYGVEVAAFGGTLIQGSGNLADFVRCLQPGQVVSFEIVDEDGINATIHEPDPESELAIQAACEIVRNATGRMLRAAFN